MSNLLLCGSDGQYCRCAGIHNQAELDAALTELNRKVTQLRAALMKAKPIVGAATASATNKVRPFREKAYNQIEAALKL